MGLPTISAIYRYPVKSMAGESLNTCPVDEFGLLGDRAWAVRDEVNGGIRGAKKIAGLMKLAARYAEPPVSRVAEATIDIPGGGTVSTSDADVSERVSEAVGHPVSLWPLQPADALDHYRRGAPSSDDFEAEMRALFGREPDEPLPDLSQFPPELFEFESPPGTYFDAYPLLLMSETSLGSMTARQPASAFDTRRFRPNILIDMGDTGEGEFPEMAWVGRELKVGDCRLQVTLDCPRCVMVTHPFDDLPKDPAIMRALVKANGGHLGVYATVVDAGTVNLGDTIEVV